MRFITIIGCGLMGGSLGLALKMARPDLHIAGWDVPGTLESALQRGAIDEAAPSLYAAVDGADLIILATPLSSTMQLIEELKGHIPADTWIHDLCSVKAPVAVKVGQELGHHRFLGGHPMTGSEKSGIRFADAALYENATYVVCPGQQMPRDDSYHVLMSLLEATGAMLLEMDTETHDRIAAHVSHVPQLLSVLLVNLADEARSRDPQVLRLAAGGFRDMTRIASSPFPMWEDILQANQADVHEALSSFRKALESLILLLENGHFERIAELFQSAEQTRDFIPADGKGFLKPLADVFVFTQDRPGALVSLTSTLYEADLSIKDIELLRIRENRGGTFRIGFETSREAIEAIKVLSAADFTAYRL
jgi:prephenate dehydrogenase